MDEPVENIPDLSVNGNEFSHLEKKNNVICRSDGLSLLMSLNKTQMHIYFLIFFIR